MVRLTEAGRRVLELERMVAALTDGFRASEERVAELEEGLRDVLDAWNEPANFHSKEPYFTMVEKFEKACALLSQSDSVAAAPPSVLVDEAPERVEGYHAPAALPAEVGE